MNFYFTDNNVSKRELGHLVSGAKALVSVLKIWSSDSQVLIMTSHLVLAEFQ